MSNPTSVVTERRLGAFYQEILPYLGGSADAGFTPVGTIISVMGVTAPANYLACDGQVVNIADYPELANYFYQQFGSKNKFGGDGTTTFAVPDLRGEFLRGTGTNSHTNQGSGAAVGTHQNATEHLEVRLYGDSGGKARFFAETTNNTASSAWSATEQNADTVLKQTNRYAYQTDSKALSTYTSANDKYRYTSRPTNTSVLYCIATKNIYLNPSNDYSTDEKVVGTWIDGKTLFQRTIHMTTPSTGNAWGNLSNPATYDLSFIGIDKLVYVDGFIYYDNGNRHISNILNSSAGGNIWSYLWGTDTQLAICVSENNANLVNKPAYVTIRYTKTT